MLMYLHIYVSYTFRVSIYPLQMLVRRDAIGVKILLAYIRRTGVETSTSLFFRWSFSWRIKSWNTLRWYDAFFFLSSRFRASDAIRLRRFEDKSETIFSAWDI